MIWRFTFVVIAFAVSCLTAAGAARLKPANWFPLQSSNSWEFVSEETTNLISVRGTGSKVQVTGLFGSDRRVLRRGSSLYVQYAGGISPLFLFGRGLNSPWTVRFSKAPCDRYEARWIATNGAVITQAGTFRDCRILTLERQLAGGCAEQRQQDLYICFAQDIGPVMLASSDEPALLLASANIGEGRVLHRFGRPPPTDNMSLEVSGTIFTNWSVWGSCKVCSYPAQMPFRLTFSNNLFQPVCVGQQVDVKLVDPSGRVLKCWSEEPDFGRRIFPDVIAPGQTVTWNGSVELADRLGGLLVNDVQVLAIVSARLLPPYAEDCSLKWFFDGPIVSATEQTVFVFLRSEYIGGVITGPFP